MQAGVWCAAAEVNKPHASVCQTLEGSSAQQSTHRWLGPHLKHLLNSGGSAHGPGPQLQAVVMMKQAGTPLSKPPRPRGGFQPWPGPVDSPAALLWAVDLGVGPNIHVRLA